MTESANGENNDQARAFPTQGSLTEHTLKLSDGKLSYQAIAEWISLRKIHKPVAHVFHTAYLAKTSASATRPLTFVFNGGPGAASAYLHMGALGPQRVAFGSMGSLPQPPTRIVDNHETWLAFTDLVFVDPVGTGFSRALKDKNKHSPAKSTEQAHKQPEVPQENDEFWEVDKDIESLGEFICRFLSKHHRWTSPLFIAGESYGGFRVAKMARSLQEKWGVGLCGALLISPAIEFSSLFCSDYNVSPWVELFPSFAAVAHYHGRTRNLGTDASIGQVVRLAEQFASSELTRWLAQGEQLPAGERAAYVEKMSDFIGLPPALLERAGGRIASEVFCRELLREERLRCGVYDAAITTVDPFPDRNDYQGPDATLSSIDRLFTAGINHQLRATLKVDTDLDYRLLSMQVHEAWKDKSQEHVFRKLVGAMDDLRYGMSLNRHMKVFISHGHFDLVTPYYSSGRLVNLMKLAPDQQQNLVTQNFDGGHMFYTWDDSRSAFLAAGRSFYDSTT